MLRQYDIPRADHIRISVFENKNSTHVYTCTTLKCFFDAVRGVATNTFKDSILELRQVDKDTDKSRYDSIKSGFRCCTPSCECRTSRTDHPDRNNGVICIDIDKGSKDDQSKGKGNAIADHEWPILRNLLGKFPYVYFSALSAGGKGVFLMIAVDPSQNHKDVYLAFAAMMKSRYNINVDTSCTDIGRLRFTSYDPEAIEKHPTELFTIAPQSVFKPKPKKTYATIGNDDYDRVRAAANVCVAKCVQLYDYNEWYKVAAALKALPDGYQIFDSVSRYSANYKGSADTLKKYSQVKTLTKINPGTFIEICRQHGVTDDEINAEWRMLKGRTASAETMRQPPPPTPVSEPRPTFATPMTPPPPMTPTPTPEATHHRQRPAFELDRFGIPLWDGHTQPDDSLPF